MFCCRHGLLKISKYNDTRFNLRNLFLKFTNARMSNCNSILFLIVVVPKKCWNQWFIKANLCSYLRIIFVGARTQSQRLQPCTCLSNSWSTTYMAVRDQQEHMLPRTCQHHDYPRYFDCHFTIFCNSIILPSTMQLSLHRQSNSRQTLFGEQSNQSKDLTILDSAVASMFGFSFNECFTRPSSCSGSCSCSIGKDAPCNLHYILAKLWAKDEASVPTWRCDCLVSFSPALRAGEYLCSKSHDDLIHGCPASYLRSQWFCSETSLRIAHLHSRKVIPLDVA